MEDYKERYEKALETVQEILSSGQDRIALSRLKLRLEPAFPELKETKDEHIRKSLVKAFDGICKKEWGGLEVKEVLAWLEKQGTLMECLKKANAEIGDLIEKNYNLKQETSPIQPNVVDLGLPSGLLWCSHNVGAERPEDYGLYFSWGNIEKGKGLLFNEKSYASTKGIKRTCDITEFSGFDAARENMGGKWRMPTKGNFKELINNTDQEWVDNYNGTGVNGCKFIKKDDHDVFIFLPAAGYYHEAFLYNDGSYGYYWSSALYSLSYGYNFDFRSGSAHIYSCSRHFGFPVRAVQQSNNLKNKL